MNRRNPTPAWLAAFSEAPPAPAEPGLDLIEAPPEWSPSLAERARARIIFDGGLDNGADLRSRLGDRLSPGAGDADLVAHAYQCWGEDAVARFRGIFALLIWDRDRGVLLCARDPLGMHPLFYAETRRALLLSPSIETLLGHQDVPAEIDRTCLVDRLTRGWLERDGTCFARVRRVPPGHVMRVGREGRRVYRYWNPVPPGRPIDWIPDSEARERFGGLLEQAVGRCLASGTPGVYLSGGLDSATVATVAADLCRGRGRAMPWALSLLFPGLDRDEGSVPRGVATALGLPQIRLPFDEAAGPEGTLAAALELTRTIPAPLSLIWRPALLRLALDGRGRGCEVILTGDGADEWLHENPFLIADFLRSLDLVGLHRVWRSYSRSYHFSRQEVVRMLLWRYGARQLLWDAWRTAAVRMGVPGMVPRRWRFPMTIAVAMPRWLAPDPALRAQTARRLEESYPIDETVPRNDSYYLRDTRSRLDAADKWLLHEEAFLLARRTAVPVRQPFWDPDLIELLVRVRPLVRSEGGLAKALVRGPLVRRFPHLGFEGQRKSWLGGAFLSVVAGQAGRALQAMGGVRTLGELGVVDSEQVGRLIGDALAGTAPQSDLVWTWDILNLEAWARAHS